jgi:pyruvate dehydrogenase E2 component (dihydrolipoamide acetyltransferase)
MAKSHREIPHYYLDTWIDMSTAMLWLEQENRKRPVAERLLYSALLMRAVTLAAAEVPEVNGFWRDDAVEASEAVHLGVGVSLPDGGLIAPAILDADQLDLGGVMAALRDVVQRARRGGLRGSELTSGTITVTNLGERGVDTVFGLIYPPQVALVGFGKLVERPWAENGMVGARPQVHASLSGDHRASNGHRGALFLAAIDGLLQHPEQL